jgi:hypothetical protein
MVKTFGRSVIMRSAKLASMFIIAVFALISAAGLKAQET